MKYIHNQRGPVHRSYPKVNGAIKPWQPKTQIPKTITPLQDDWKRIWHLFKRLFKGM